MTRMISPIGPIGLTVLLTLLAQTARAEKVTCWQMSANERLPPPVRVEATAKGEFEVMWPTHRTIGGGNRACIWIESHTLASGKRSFSSTVTTTGRYLVHVEESEGLRKLFSRTASVSLRMRLEDRHGTLRIALFRQPVKKTAKALACERKDFSGLGAVARKKAYEFEESVCARIVGYDGEELTPPEILNDKSHADRLVARAKDYLQAAYIEVAAPGAERGRYPLGFENKDPCSFIMSTATVSKAASDLALEIRSSTHADARDKSIFLRTAFELPEAVQTCWSFIDTPVGPWVQDVETSTCPQKGSNERCRRVPLSRIVGSDHANKSWLYAQTDKHIRRYIGVTPPGRYVGQVRVGGAPPRRFQIDIPPERSLLQTSLYLGILLSIGLGGFVALRIAIFQASRRIRNLAEQTRRARTEMVECGGLRFDVFDRAEVAASVARSSSHPSAEERFRDHLSWLDNVPLLNRARRGFSLLVAEAPWIPPLVATAAALVIWLQWKASIFPDFLVTFAAVGLLVGCALIAWIETVLAIAVWAIASAVVNSPGDVGLNALVFTIFVVTGARQNILGGAGATAIERTVSQLDTLVGLARRRAQVQSLVCPGALPTSRRLVLLGGLDELDTDLASIGDSPSDADAERIATRMDQLTVAARSKPTSDKRDARGRAKLIFEGEVIDE